MVLVTLHPHQNSIAGAGVQVLKDIAVLPVAAAVNAVFSTRNSGSSQGGRIRLLQVHNRGLLLGLLDNQSSCEGAGSHSISVVRREISGDFITASIDGRSCCRNPIRAHISDGYRRDALNVVRTVVCLGSPIVGRGFILQHRRQWSAVLHNVKNRCGHLIRQFIAARRCKINDYLIIANGSRLCGETTITDNSHGGNTGDRFGKHEGLGVSVKLVALVSNDRELDDRLFRALFRSRANLLFIVSSLNGLGDDGVNGIAVQASEQAVGLPGLAAIDTVRNTIYHFNSDGRIRHIRDHGS